MTETFYIKQSDDVPVIEAQLTDAQDNPVDLSDASVEFHMAEPRGGQTVINADALVTEPTEGVVQYVWSDTDTSQAGRYRAEFEVTYANGDTDTYPNVGYKTIYIDSTIEA